MKHAYAHCSSEAMYSANVDVALPAATAHVRLDPVHVAILALKNSSRQLLPLNYVKELALHIFTFRYLITGRVVAAILEKKTLLRVPRDRPLCSSAHRHT